MEKRTNHHRLYESGIMNMLKRVISIVIAATMIVYLTPESLIPTFGVKTEAEAATTLSNPRIATDSTATSGQKVTWDCVWFGSYPQTEIVDQTSTSGCYEKAWSTESDYEVNASLYTSLQNASYDTNGDTIIGNTKYRRINSGDATYYSEYDYDVYYSWTGSDTYRYFRYDPIKWRVLNVNGNQAFLLADEALDDQPYNTSYTSVTWETSTIRSWLNGYGSSLNTYGTDYSSKNFIDNAFSSSEQNAIVSTSVVNDDSISFGTEGGNNTTDKIFLLSESEIYSKSYGFITYYLAEDLAKRSMSSPFAKAMGVMSYDSGSYLGKCWWILRSPGNNSNDAVDVCYNGAVSRVGCEVHATNCGCRPALNLNLSSSDVWSYAGTVCDDGTVNLDATPGSGENTDIDEEIVMNARSQSIIGKINTSGSYALTYDENDFSSTSYEYNHELARFACGLSLAQYGDLDDLKDVFTKLGYKDYFYWGDDSEKGLYSPFTLAHHKVILDGEETELLIIDIRGTYEMEWLDNFDPIYEDPSAETHEGFNRAAKNLIKELEKYIYNSSNAFNKSDKLKILVTGHSRGAAVANLVGYYLDNKTNNAISNLNYNPTDVFVYTFATPNVTSDKSRTAELYGNIFNIVNPEDFVTKVLASSWGYGRYGITYVLPSKTTDFSGKGNYVNYKTYKSRIIQISKELNASGDYESYLEGMKPISRLIYSMKKEVPDIWAYYEKDLSASTSTVDTLHDLLKYALGGSQCKNQTYVDRSKNEIAKAASLGYGLLGERIITYFGLHQKLVPTFAYAHRCETYYAGMQSITKSQLQQKRTTLKGIVNCPVDVKITDSDGEIVGLIKNNEIDESIDGILMEVDGDSKIFYLPCDTDYTVTLTGNESGSMDYSVCDVDGDTCDGDRVTFLDVPVTFGESMLQTINSDDDISDLTLTDQSNSEVIKPKYYDENSNNTVSINVSSEGPGEALGITSCMPGDYITVCAVPNAVANFVGWFEENEKVSSDERYSFSVKKDRNLVAHFELKCNTGVHQWNEGEITKGSTVNEEGIRTYTCTVCGITKTEIIPKVQPVVPGTSLKSVKNVKGKKLIIKWQRNTAVNGYMIQMSTKKNFSSGVIQKIVCNNRTASIKSRKLKKKKTYYVRVCTYLVVNGQFYYSNWSNVKKVKIKK